ncbi:hypothetical protein CERSUDRAFT_147722 [Gelatoporia subvermispora B]|uniref:FAS1 domain-containing protein n=1 Tax=Ceriporiopsis subvermispora (strain B) TaxID=914234 RepID=M2QYB7_CERS8|nr:hypothetical protein CERSUDRAFT_147722 [Gelatoporia subvermispora B]
MRSWTCYPLALLALLPLSAASQLPLQHPSPHTLSFNLVDALGNDSDYSSLLVLLQHARLIPTLNRLNGSTFFAPTNDAVKHHATSNALWQAALSDSGIDLKDNIREQLRQELFYHLINYTIPVLPTEQTPQIHRTLLFPRTPIEPPSREPPPYPPWMPIPGGTLGGEPQRLRVAYRDETIWTGVDAAGNQGVKVVKEIVNASNGRLLGVGEWIESPPDIATVILRHPSLKYLANILTPEIIQLLNKTAPLTVFIPVDSAWESLPYYERLYLESEFATDDLVWIMNMHAVAQKHVRWSDTISVAENFTTIAGPKLEVIKSSEDHSIKVASATVVEPDIYATNGVLHTVDSLLFPPESLQLTPEKYLLVLNCTSFISLLHSVNLTGLVNDTEAQYTILAPRDDVIELFGDDDLPERGSEELRKLLQYHFIPGRWTAKKLKNGMLLETALEEPGLGGGRQVLDIEVTDENKKAGKTRAVRFGGAGIIGEPEVEVDNTIIYFVSRPLVPPADPLQTALPSLEFSSFLAAIFSSTLADVLKTSPRTTLLLPPNDAFQRLGMLVSAHLLGASSKPDLERVILHHALNGVSYASELQNGSARTFPTLEGSDVHLERKSPEDGGILLLSPSGGWADMHSALSPRDMLTSTGVIHEVSDIMIPRSVDLTVGKLVRAAKGSTMATMMTKAGLDWILNGTAPPEGSPWAEIGLSGTGWTLLCPTDDAFKQINLTALYADQTRLREIVSQHLIPSQASAGSGFAPHPLDVLNNNRPIVVDDSATYTTLHTVADESAYGDIIFRTLDHGTDGESTVVGIRGARGRNGQRDWARVLSWGRATTGRGTGGVVQIDRLLTPYYPPWWLEYGAPVGVGIGGSDSGSADEAQLQHVASTSTANSIKSFVAGGFGGIASVLVGHPFDLTKTRLQTASQGTYTGAMDVVKKTLARDGATGLYRGVVPPILGVTPIFALSFWAYDMSKKLVLAVAPSRANNELSVPELATAGFLSAIPTTLVTAPVERAKVLLQVQGQGQSGPRYNGVFDVMRHVYKEGGLKSVFRGTTATIARDGPGNAAYFAAYEVTKKLLTPAGASPSDLNLGAVIVAGGTAGVAMWSIAIPPDVLKSRIQSAPTGTYSGFLDCARKTIAADGVKALWKGLGPAMARAFPANAATFLGVEYTRQLMDKYF